MAKINQLFIIMLTILKTVHKTNHAKISAKGFTFSRKPFGTLSQVTKDVRKASSLSDPMSGFDLSNKKRGHYANKLSDYDASLSDAAQNFEAMALPITHQMSEGYSREHPFEEAAKEQRQKADVFGKLQANECLLTNLPQELESWMSTPAKLREYLVQTVHKDLEVAEIKYVKSVTSAAQGTKYAYIVIKLGSKRQAHLVNKSLRKLWIGDSLLKIRMQEDVKKEAYDNRTIIIRELPTHLNQRQILETFGEENGAIVGIELPMENVAMAEYVEERNITSSLDPVAQEKARKFKLAQIAVKQSLELDAIHKDSITKELGVDVMDTILKGDLMSAQNVIDAEKQKALVRIITRLQAEGHQVLSQKYELLEIRDNNNSHSSVATAESLRTRISENKDSIEQVMLFLKENEVTAPQIVHGSLEKLLALGQGELAHAYDTLIQALEEREKRIEERIGKQLQHFGIDERVLLDKRDYKLELEDLPSAQMYKYRPEEVISVNDQINYVLGRKNLSAEEKFSGIMNRHLNPFHKPLFNEEQLLLADESEYLKKELELFDVYRKSKSVIRMMREGSKFTRESRQLVDQMVDEYKDNYTVAFDELYHREKGLVEAVVAADKALKTKEATFENLMKFQNLSKHEIDQLTRSSILSDDQKDLFERGQERMEARVLKQNLQEDAAGTYEFSISKVHKLKSMVESGEITQSEYQNLMQVAREQEMRNRGYCFLTFSHSDEARLMILKNQNIHLDGRRIQLDLKASLDHSEMDFDFLVGRLKNDERVVKEVQNLREARQELREFESEMDGQLPNRKKLKEFRDLARNVIAGSSHTDNAVPGDRTGIDEERLRLKVKEFEKKYPHVDLSQLFNTEKAEDARKSLHKNAFASFKAYQFLKHGINQEPSVIKAQQSEAKRRLEENDPYNFPELDETVSKVLSKDVIQPRIIDHGEQINKPGRRFNGYTDQEFIEAYFGKDLMRNHVIDRSRDPLFLEQKSLKEMYPVSKYLKAPTEQWKQQQLENLGYLPGYEQYDPERQAVYSKDPAMALLEKRMEDGFNDGSFIINKAHPDDPKRDLLTDMERTLSGYEKRKFAELEFEAYDMKEISRIRKHYQEQYQTVQDYRPWIKDLRQGKWDDAKALSNPDDVREGEATEGVEETEDAKFQTEYDTGLDPQAKRVNAEYMYDYSQKKDMVDAEDYSRGFKKLAESENLTHYELASEASKRAHLEKAGHKYGGKWFAQHEAGVETPREPTKASGNGRSLQSFVDEEEDDVYEMYQRQLNQRPEDDNNYGNTEAKFNLNEDMVQPDLPRFQEFLNDKAQGVHPFDKITDKVNEQLGQVPKSTETEMLADKELYQRELLGRMMGEKLTPRQYELITGQYSAADSKLKRVKDVQNQIFFDKRQWISLAQEHVEKIRRRKVIAGEWTEEESAHRLDHFIKEAYAELPGPNEQRKFLRDMYTVADAVQLLDNPERLLEKEYYFDETLGESLNAHCTNLKERYPGMRVQARRDRDGFAIIKTLYDNSYKYDIDRLEAWNPEQATLDKNQTIEAILQAILPEDSQQIIDDVTSKLETTIPMLQGQKSFELDAFTKLRIQSLVNQKFEGRIEVEDVVKQLFVISGEAKDDKSKPLSQINGTIYDEGQSEKGAHEELLADRERFRVEVYEQLMKRVKKHMYQTKREDKDFVKPRVSEDKAFQGQVLSHENALAGLEGQVNGVDETGENFDRKAFKKMKDEIKARKAAKERLLSQGLPQFKPYLRL